MQFQSFHQQHRTKVRRTIPKVYTAFASFFFQAKTRLLKFSINNKHDLQFTVPWNKIFSGFVLLFILFFSREVAKIITLESPLFARTTEVSLEEQTGGKTQIVVKSGRNSQRISNESFVSTGLVTSDQYAVWMADIDGFWQLFVYDKLSKKTLQLTAYGNNVDPQIFGNIIGWKSQVDGIWQIMIFDGTKISQLTETSQSIEEFILNGDLLAYSHLDQRSTYMDIYVKDLLSNKVTQINGEDSGHSLELSHGKIQWKDQGGDIHVYPPPKNSLWQRFF